MASEAEMVVQAKNADVVSHVGQARSRPGVEVVHHYTEFVPTVMGEADSVELDDQARGEPQ